MIQIRCKCGREIQLVGIPESRMAKCSGCYAEVLISDPDRPAPEEAGRASSLRDLWITCTGCLKVYTRPLHFAGQKMECVKCGTLFRIPLWNEEKRSALSLHRQRERIILTRLNLAIVVISLLIILAIAGVSGFQGG